MYRAYMYLEMSGNIFKEKCGMSTSSVPDRKFLGLPDPDPLVRGTDQDPSDPSIVKQKL